MADTVWTAAQLADFEASYEVRVCAAADGRLGGGVPVWAVAVNGNVYVRAYRGRGGGWFRRASRVGKGAVVTATTTFSVRFEEPDGAVRVDVDAAYRGKYGRSSVVRSILTDEAAAATLQVLPAEQDGPTRLAR